MRRAPEQRLWHERLLHEQHWVLAMQDIVPPSHFWQLLQTPDLPLPIPMSGHSLGAQRAYKHTQDVSSPCALVDTVGVARKGAQGVWLIQVPQFDGVIPAAGQEKLPAVGANGGSWQRLAGSESPSFCPCECHTMPSDPWETDIGSGASADITTSSHCYITSLSHCCRVICPPG